MRRRCEQPGTVQNWPLISCQVHNQLLAYPGVITKYLKHAGDVLQGVTDDKDQDDEQGNSGQSALSFAQAGFSGSSHLLKLFSLVKYLR